MAFAPLSPELREKALSIASSFASGGMVAKFQVGGSVSETAASEDVGTADVDAGPGPSSDNNGDDPMGMAGLAAEAEAAQAGLGISDEDNRAAAEEALSAMEDAMQGGGEADEVARAVENLAKQQLAPEKTGILSSIKNALDRDKDGKISAGEAALGALMAATPLGPMMALGKGIENIATAAKFGTKVGSEQTGMLAEQERGLFDIEEEEEERGGDDRQEDVPEIEEALTVEELTKPPTIDIVPFRPQDFYYFYPQQRYGLPSMMNMRTQ